MRDNVETLHGAIDDGAIAIWIPKHAKKELDAYLEDVLPEVALRQWVLTFQFPWRRRLAEDGALFGALTRIFVESVERFDEERAARRGACGAAKSGAVTVVQRTSSDMRLNPHLHVVFLDGAYHEDGTELVWNELGHLQTREVGSARPRASRPAPHAYAPREPHQTVLYGLVQEHLATFVAHAARTYAAPLPKYVVAAFEGYLACGDLARGFVRCHTVSYPLYPATTSVTSVAVTTKPALLWNTGGCGQQYSGDGQQQWTCNP